MSRVVPMVNLSGASAGDLSWDYAFVYENNSDLAHDRAAVVQKMQRAGLIVGKLLASNNHDVILLVTASRERFEEEADRQSIEMKLLPKYQDAKTGCAGYAEFSLATKDMFAGNELPRFFSSLERQRLLFTIFEAPRSEHGCGFNLEEFKAPLFKNVFPLHDEAAQETLNQTWVARWFKAQPLDDIRDYFGEKIAMYFTFLGHYTLWLGFLSILGTIAQILQWVKHDADHPIVPAYCICLCLWTTLFLESWKRKQVVQAFKWDVQDFEEEERVRPEYVGVETKGVWIGDNFIDESEVGDAAADLEVTKFFPYWKRAVRYLLSAPVIGMFLTTTIIGTVAILAFRGIMSLPASNGGMGKTGQILGGMLNAGFITFMNVLYKKVAVWLNDFENYRTDTEYEDALIGKVFCFQFVNSYISLFYIAFIKEHDVTIFGMQSGRCRTSCLDEMSTQLLSLVVLMQFVGNFRELAIPIMMAYMKRFLAARKAKKSGNVDTDALRVTKYEYQANMAVYGSTFDEYNEMAIQFGFVTLFAAAFPVASLASFANNVIEIRSDAYKLLLHTQRPHYRGCEDIGSWQKVFEVVATLAVLTNVCLVGFTSLILSGKCQFTSDFPPGCKGKECEFYDGDNFRAVLSERDVSIGSHTYHVDCSGHKHHNMCCPVITNESGTNIVDEVASTLFLTPFHVLMVVVICEHALLFIRFIIGELIPDTPGWVTRAQARIDFKKDHDLKALKGETTTRKRKDVAHDDDDNSNALDNLPFITPRDDEIQN